MMKNFSGRKLLVWLTLALLFTLTSAGSLNDESPPHQTTNEPAEAHGKCEVNATTYLCPHCGGTEVKDCLEDCRGYVNTDTVNHICFARHLFSHESWNTEDPDHYYHYLWNDLVGMVVWFFTAGVAMACGVGGGGIYVPLGILLFQFAPKPASGLSQSSIFGASLGGLLLNCRDKHPVQTIRNQPGEYNEEQHRHLQKTLTLEEQLQYEQSQNSYYTRPLIHYDMALFLSPMEMAGAVLGVLIQAILPNWLYLLIAGVVLAFTAYKTYVKFLAARKNEKAKRAQEEQLERELQQGAKTLEVEALLEQQIPPNEVVKMTSLLAGGTTTTNESNDQIEIVPNTKALQPQEFEIGGTTADLTSQSPSASDSAETGSTQNGLAEPNNHNDKSGMDVVPEHSDTNLENSAALPMEIDVTTNPPEDEETKKLRIAYLEEDMREFPIEKLVALLVLWVGLFLLTLMKGGKGVESIIGIQCTSPVYYVLIAVQFLWMFGFSLFFGRKAYQKQMARVAVQYPYLPDDPIWDGPSLRFYGAFTFIAGIVAGLIGIGGGMVLGPLMLIMGIHPRVSSATTATMIVLTSSSVAVMFVTSGKIPWEYAVFYFGICFGGAVLGKSQIDSYVKRTGRASMLIFILATIIALATIGCFVILFTRLSAKNWCLDGFHKFCSVSDHGGDEEECPADRFLQEVVSQFQS